MYTVIYSDVSKLKLPESIMTSLSDRDVFSYIQSYHDTTYLVLNYPKKSDLMNIVCLSYNDIDGFILYLSVTDASNFEGVESVDDLLFKILSQYEILITRVDDSVKEFENMIDTLANKENTLKLYGFRQEIINYKSSIDSFADVLDFVVSQDSFELESNGFQSLYSALLIELKQIERKMDITINTIDSIQQIAESMYTNKLTQTMNYLTIITILFGVPNFLTSLYETGIIKIPILEFLFPVIIAINVILTLVMIYRILANRKK